MKKFAPYVFAFCTFWAVLFDCSGARGSAPKLGENFAHYKKSQIQWGALTLPLAAQLNYQAAIHELQKGDSDRAVSYLEEAIRLNPQFPDAYLTISRIKFKRFDTDALYFLVQGFRCLLCSYSSQSLFVVNVALIVVLMLVVLTSIVCLSFAVRYLPFLAHKLTEVLTVRFHGVLPRLTAYMIILVPFVLFPGFVSGFCFLVLMTWYFLHKRERFLLISLAVPFVLLAVLAPRTKQLNPMADPHSFTYLTAKAANSPGDTRLIKAIASNSIPLLQAEKHNVLGLLYLRQENFEAAASHFLRAIEISPGEAMGYVNLGNVYYLQGMYEKALEGYRKAAQIDDGDAAGQYNLAQAYIKTLLMAESSTALKNASEAGIEDIKQSYAEMVRSDIQVFPKTFTGGELWRIARIESRDLAGNYLNDVLRPITRQPASASAALLAGALLIALILSRLFKERHLSFQCSNCGELTCDNCCDDSGGMFLCPACSEVIRGVSSDKVIEALLRQRRHAVVVKRRRSIRVLTIWIPGVRDLFYGRLTRGVGLAFVFSLSLVLLWSKGYVVKDWNSLVTTVPLWKWLVPIAGITAAYVLSFSSKQYREVRNYRTPTMRQRRKDAGKDGDYSLNKASA